MSEKNTPFLTPEQIQLYEQAIAAAKESSKEEVTSLAEKATEVPTAPKIDFSKIRNDPTLSSKSGVAEGSQFSGKRKGKKFNFVQPELIQLPSGGRFYTNITDDQDIANGFIKLTPMTVKEEEILSTSRFLKTGSATRMVIDNCIASDIEAKDILLFDSNYLLFFLRKITYGDDYKFTLDCPSCEQKFEHVVKISELSFEELPERAMDPISVKLPMCKYTVEFILPRLYHSEALYQRDVKKKKSTQDADAKIVDNLIVTTTRILDPDGDEVPKSDWEEFFTALIGGDRAELSAKAKFDTGVDKLENVKCPYCQADYSGSIPIGIDFFRF